MIAWNGTRDPYSDPNLFGIEARLLLDGSIYSE